MPRNRRFHWILPATEGSALHWIPPAKETLSPLDSPANRALSPLLETPSQRNCRPFGFPARFERSTHKWKMVCGRSFQNTKIPRTPSCKKMKSWEFFQQSILAPPFSVSRSPPSGWCIPCRSKWKASESGPWPPAGSQWGSKKYMNMKHLEAMEPEPLSM